MGVTVTVVLLKLSAQRNVTETNQFQQFRNWFGSVSFRFCKYISQVIGWEDYALVISFVSKGFPYKEQIEELFIVMVYCMYSQNEKIVNLLISLFN